MSKLMTIKINSLRIVFSGLVAAAILLSGSAQAKVNALPDAILYRFQGSEIVSPGIRTVFDSSSGDEMIPIIVTLKAQANVSNVLDRNRSVRLRRVILALQNMASATQGQIIDLLETYLSEGLVSQYESYWVFNGLAVTATQQVIEELAARPEVALITLDKTFSAPAGHESMGPPEENLYLVNAEELWHLGYLGQGIVVANMDTGVSLYHPELSSRWRGGTNSWFDPYNEHPSEPFDSNGHGTQTMGVMVAGDADGTTIGVAPEAQWIAVKIFDDQDNATVSAIHSGIQWLLDPDGDPFTPDAPHVINNSWTFQAPGCDLEFELDLLSLRAAGIVPVFAAGNSGPGSGTSISPANNPSAFAVGGVDDLENIYTYSSRGPSACGEPESIYPELVAPGVDVKTTDLFGQYTSATGTSLSAPHVSGALALLLDAFPNLLASEQEAALLNGALDLGAAGTDNDFGYGRLDILASYQWLNSLPTVTPTPEPVINLALEKLVTFSSYQDGGHDGNMAVDGDLGTYWQTKRANGKNKLPSEWITVDLGSSVSISEVVLAWGENYATSYTIQSSEDNNSWTNLVSTASGDGGNDTYTFATTSARYVKMESTAWSNGSLRSWLLEFEIYANGGSSNPTPTASPDPTSTPSPTPTPTSPPSGGTSMHVGDLDGISETARGNRWDATVTILVEDAEDSPVSDATVGGIWSDGASGGGSCITGANGLCSLTMNNIKGGVGSVNFTIDNVSHAAIAYDPATNQDPEGDSDGTSITILRP